MTDESRRHLRVFRRSSAVFVASSGAQAEGQVLDMSLGGLRFRSLQRLEKGDSVTSEIVLPGGRRFPIEGTIAYRRETSPYSYGLSFAAAVQERLVALELGNL
jgi:hypothetical protein